jgi:hypothetical protein
VAQLVFRAARDYVSEAAGERARGLCDVLVDKDGGPLPRGKARQ